MSTKAVALAMVKDSMDDGSVCQQGRFAILHQHFDDDELHWCHF